jgi:uncharacterized protein (DUF58 family)
MGPERDRRPGPDPALKRSRRGFRPPRSLRATRAGWCFIAIIFGVGFAALNTGNNLLYLVLALMLAFLVLSGLLSESSLRGIRVVRTLPREIFARCPNRVMLRIRNEQKRVASFAISLEDQLQTSSGPSIAGRSFVLRVGPEEISERSYVFEPEMRGDLHFDRIRVSTRFPFGLFVKSVELEAQQTALAFPAVYATPICQDETRASRDPEERDGVAQRGHDVTGLREFIPGDTLGRVHWRRSLRLGRLLVGEREGEASGEIEVELHAAKNASETVLEEQIARAASMVVSHLDAGLRVGLRSPGACFPPAMGFGHRNDLLTYLARVSADSLAPPRMNDGPPAFSAEDVR